MLAEIIGWLDAQAWRYWSVALTATALWAAALVAPWRDPDGSAAPSRRGELEWWLWAGSSLLLLLAWRWPFMLGPGFNPDEPQMIAGAITLKRFPVYWEYVDGTTHGPLANVPLLIGNALGLPLDYAGARFVAGLLVIGGEASPMRAFHRERYLADFERSRPRIFVVAVGGRNFWYGGRKRHLAHESFPELAEIVARDFTLVATVAGTRIYVRREGNGG